MELRVAQTFLHLQQSNNSKQKPLESLVLHPATTRYGFPSYCLRGLKKFCGGDSKNTPGWKKLRR